MKLFTSILQRYGEDTVLGWTAILAMSSLSGILILILNLFNL